MLRQVLQVLSILVRWADDVLRQVLQVLSILLLVVGGIVALLGASSLVLGLFAPSQPPPSMNEGHALAVVFGSGTTVFGMLVVGVGYAIRAWLKANA